MTALVACAVSLGIVFVLALSLALYLDYVARTLPDLTEVLRTSVTQRTTIVYAADGSVLAEWHGEQDRTVVAFEEIPPQLVDAVVATEDRRFYEHHGIDAEASLRAFGLGAARNGAEQGASTITQQVVKNLFGEGKRTFFRKIREALIANALDARSDKSRLLELYLNTVYLGRGCYGVESAAKHYFGKSASVLTLSESAMLAGMIKSPSKYGPLDRPDAARVRRDYVLGQMLEQGYITQVQWRDAQREEFTLRPETPASQVAPYFVEYVKQTLIDRFGTERVYTGGLRVFTTLEPQLQASAEKAVQQLDEKDDPEVALVTVSHADGRIRALIGGRDFSANQFNLAVQGRRQPGSAFKPFVLAAALQKGVSPTAKFSSAPYSVKVKDGTWNVQNYENAFTRGKMTLNAATNWSVNGVYARLIMLVGPENVVKMAKKMGISTPLDPDPAIALGGLRIGVSPLEMASAYGTIANGGLAVPPTGIIRVLDDRGVTIYEPESAPIRALGVETAAQEARMLHNVVEKGTGEKAKIGQWAAGKTGTTQSYRDAWFVGWAGKISTAVWVGHRDGQVAMTDVHGIKVTGGSYPASIWAEFMKAVAKSVKTESEGAVVPEAAGEERVVVRICVDSGQLANPRCPQTQVQHFEPELVGEALTCAIH